MGCSGSKNQAAVEPLSDGSSHSNKKKYGKSGSPWVPPGMGPSFPTHTDTGSPPPPDHSHDQCNATHKSPPNTHSPYEAKMVEHKVMQHQQDMGTASADRPDFIVPIPLPDVFHPRILTEISLPRHVPRPYPQLGNYDPTAAAKRSKSRNMILLFGGPGCGKGTFSARLAAEFGLTHLSLGNLLRDEAQKGTSIGSSCAGPMKEGRLVAANDVMSVLETALFATSSRNFLIEGFPRYTEQAKAFEEVLGKPKLVIFLDCSQKELERRLSKRAKSSARTDETPDIISTRIQIYLQETLPVLNYYDDVAPSLVKKIAVEGLMRSDDKIFNEISQAVNNVFFPMTSKTTFVLLLGGPGCGKGTQCGRLVEDFGFHHLSTGDLLREEIKKGSDIGKKSEKLIKDGKLVSLAVISQILQRAIIVAQRKSFLIDGIKTVDQAKEFDTKVGTPTAVLYLSCSTEVMEERLLKRSQTSGRSDDNPKTIKKRIEGFNTDSKVLIEYYKKTVPGAFFEVAADRPEADIYEEVRALVEKKTKKATKADKQIEASNKEKALEAVKSREGTRDGQTILFVLGGPGCGKGTQCDRIVADFGFTHLSAGDLLREEVKRGTQLGQKCEALMKEGKLVPAEVTLNMLQKAMSGSCSRRFLIDGYPRAVDQAKAFEDQVGRPRLVIFLDCPLETMQERLMKRGETSGRSDDNAETIKKRFNTFQEESLPVVAYYESLAPDLVIKVSSVPPPEKVYKSINNVLTALRPIFARTQPKSTQSMTVFILGGPGCGKGTNCERLVEQFGFEHLSTGDMLRKEVKCGSVIGKTVSRMMESGQLVPIEITMELLGLAMVDAEHKFFLIDGFPRAVDQAKEFDRKLGRPHLIIYLVCPLEVMQDRLLQRGQSSGRADDNMETIRNRLQTFISESKPVVDYYKRKAPHIVKVVSAERGEDEVYKEVKAIIAEKLASR